MKCKVLHLGNNNPDWQCGQHLCRKGPEDPGGQQVD